MRCAPQILAILSLSAAFPSAAEEPDYTDLDAPEHRYWERELRDPFTQFAKKVASGEVRLEAGGELPFLRSLFSALDVPATSQMLVFSTTSLQLSLISPRNPRAIYFNEDLYVGFIPGGKIEIVSIDPELGGIFYIFDIPRNSRAIAPERSDRCMNCHAKPSIGGVPGLTIKSVTPGPNGGSLESYRQGDFGHAVPLAERFGGWHVTGEGGLRDHKGNKTGRLFQGELTTFPILPGEQSNLDRYPVPTSDLLPHLLFEHQIGFSARYVEAGYRARTYWRAGGGKLRPEHRDLLKDKASDLVSYLLFAGEAPLPEGGVSGQAEYKEAFASRKIADPAGRSLRDLDLRGHLFKYRCSYMIYSNAFQGLPDWFRAEVVRQLKAALDPAADAPASRHLPPDERKAIAEILAATLDGW